MCVCVCVFSCVGKHLLKHNSMYFFKILQLTQKNKACALMSDQIDFLLGAGRENHHKILVMEVNYRLYISKHCFSDSVSSL